MKNKTFDLKLFKEALLQLKTIGIVEAAIIIVSSAYIPLSIIINNLIQPSYTNTSLIFSQSNIPILSSIYVFTPIMTFTLFKFLNKRNKSDFYHSIPQTRTCLFISFAAAIFVYQIAIILASSVVSLTMSLFAGKYLTIAFSSVLPCILNVVLATFLVMSAILISISVSGRFFPSFVFSLLILFVPRTILTVIRLTMLDSMSNVCSDRFMEWADNSINPVFYSFFSNFSEYKSIVYMFVLGTAYFAIALLLFNKRNSEAAERSTTNKIVQSIIRISFCMLFCLPAIIMIISITQGPNYSIIIAIIAVYLFAIGAYFIFELITRSGKKGMLLALKQFPIVIALNILIVIAMYAGITVFESYKPNENNIDSIRIIKTETEDYYSERYTGILSDYTGYYDVSLESKDYLSEKFKDIEITDNSLIQKICNSYNQGDYYESTYSEEDEKYNSFVNFSFAFKEGNKTKYRKSYILATDFISITNQMSKNKQFSDILTGISSETFESNFQFEDSSVRLSKNQLDTLTATAINEIKSIGISKWLQFYYLKEDYSSIGTLTLTQRDGLTNYYIDIPITSKLPETYKKLTSFKVLTDINKQNQIIEKLRKNYEENNFEIVSDADGSYSINEEKLEEFIKYLEENNDKPEKNLLTIYYYNYDNDNYEEINAGFFISDEAIKKYLY